MRDPDREHTIDELLRQAAGNPAPTAADREHAERILNRVMVSAAMTHEPERQSRRWAVPTLVGSLAAMLVAVVVLQVSQPSPAVAAFAEIAAVAELVDPITIPDQSFFYTKSETIVRGFIPPDAFEVPRTYLTYLLPKTRESWISGDGIVQIRITAHTPMFFSTTDEADYFAAGLDKNDRIGETVTHTAVGVHSILDWREWPTTPSELETAIIESLAPGSEELRDVLVAELALGLISAPAASPALRTAAIRVLSGLRDIELDERRLDGGGTFSMTYDRPHPTRMAVTIDGEGNVLRFTLTDLAGDPAAGVPPGALLEDTIYERTRIVGSLDTP